MSDRHIVLKAEGKRWSAAYSDIPDDVFDGETMQIAVDKLMESKGRVVLPERATPTPSPHLAELASESNEPDPKPSSV